MAPAARQEEGLGGGGEDEEAGKEATHGGEEEQGGQTRGEEPGAVPPPRQQQEQEQEREEEEEAERGEEAAERTPSGDPSSADGKEWAEAEARGAADTFGGEDSPSDKVARGRPGADARQGLRPPEPARRAAEAAAEKGSEVEEGEEEGRALEDEMAVQEGEGEQEEVEEAAPPGLRGQRGAPQEPGRRAQPQQPQQVHPHKQYMCSTQCALVVPFSHPPATARRARLTMPYHTDCAIILPAAAVTVCARFVVCADLHRSLFPSL